MDFLKIIQSLDELLYEIMSWLIFYPVTLWRTLVHPLKMMDYADVELKDARDEQYTDTLSPPLFLLLTLILIHSVELTVVGENELVRSNVGLKALISDDTSYIVFQALTYSLFPLVMASALVRKQGIGLDRNTLRAPFHGQCYLAAMLALGVSGSDVLIRYGAMWSTLAGLGLALATFLAYGLCQSSWFAQHLDVSRSRGFWHASQGMVASLAVAGAIGSLMG
jgi:hypothetical protein